MTAWQIIPVITQLRGEFNAIAPTRATGADGTIGDQAHADKTSDHNPDETGAVPIRDADKVNEVHALDITTDLRTPGLTMETIVQFLLGRCRSGAEKRLRYIIFDRRIWEAANGWRQKAYNLADPHTGHAHFSFSYISDLEASTASFHLEDIPVALTADDKKWIVTQIQAEVAKLPEAVAGKVWNYDADRVTPGTQTASGMLLTENRRSNATTNQDVPALTAKVDALTDTVAEVLAAVRPQTA